MHQNIYLPKKVSSHRPMLISSTNSKSNEGREKLKTGHDQKALILVQEDLKSKWRKKFRFEFYLFTSSNKTGFRPVS